MSFLIAEWKKLAIANYVIDPSILQDHIPYGTELDDWHGKHFVSLIGFMFQNTRLLGLPIPFHRNFEEVNLRFYVKRKEGNEYRRGVVFIKELVPKPALSFVANNVYQENYETKPMRHAWIYHENTLEISYQWKNHSDWQKIKIQADNKLESIPIGSETESIIEHYWGYAKRKGSKSNEYEVTHPKWEAYPVKDYKIKVDFGATYGNQFQFLNQEKPHSIMLAEGSSITVENKRVIK